MRLPANSMPQPINGKTTITHNFASLTSLSPCLAAAISLISAFSLASMPSSSTESQKSLTLLQRQPSAFDLLLPRLPHSQYAIGNAIDAKPYANVAYPRIGWRASWSSSGSIQAQTTPLRSSLTEAIARLPACDLKKALGAHVQLFHR
mmetsp:Transcript_54374/g.129577  ORF Transcript_54374/g.129577 Transcript_54374/m.129577 type:complete len:148 (-) Transcript_54374:38-481(-)